MKILIADDHALFCDVLVQYLHRSSPEIIIKTVSDFSAAKQELKKNTHYDLVLLDIGISGMNGLCGLENLKKEYPQTRIAIMSGIADKEEIKKITALDNIACFPKTLPAKDFLESLYEIVNGGAFKIKTQENKDILKTLSPREKEVLNYLKTASSNKEIARALNIQPVTVKVHLQSICAKLDAKNRTDAALKAQRMGFYNET